MHRKNIFLVLLLGVFVISPLALADSGEQTEIEVTLVDFPGLLSSVMGDEDIDNITHEIVNEIAMELGYELVVNTATMELYLEGILDTISDFAREDVTEKVEEILTEEEKIEELDMEIEDFDEIEEIREIFEDVEELMELPQVKDITQEIFNQL